MDTLSGFRVNRGPRLRRSPGMLRGALVFYPGKSEVGCELRMNATWPEKQLVEAPKVAADRIQKWRRKNLKSCSEEFENWSGRISKVARKIFKSAKVGAPESGAALLKKHTKWLLQIAQNFERKNSKTRPEEFQNPPGRI